MPATHLAPQRKPTAPHRKNVGKWSGALSISGSAVTEGSNVSLQYEMAMHHVSVESFPSLVVQ